MNNFSMQPHYDFQNYTVTQIKGMIEKNQIVLPRFQRNLVWSRQKKQDLLNSIRMGIPIGVFLLAGEKQPFLLLDGLQRATSIMGFYNDIQKYFDKYLLDNELLISLRKLLIDLGVEAENIDLDQLGNLIESWVVNSTDTNPNNTFNGFYLAKHLFELFKVSPENQNLFQANELFQPIFSGIAREREDLGNIQVPCIIYKGPAETLPVIFEKLNSTGTTLSKFQIFAANWVKNFIPLSTDNSLKKIIYDEYNNRQTESDIEIEGLPHYEEEFLEADLNLYEYLLAIGRKLENDFPSLFHKKGDSIGFNLSAACLLGSIRKIVSLGSKMDESFNGQAYQRALFDSSQIVYDRLKPFIDLRINKANSSYQVSPRVYHSDYQIVSFVAKVFREKYDLTTFAPRQDWTNEPSWLEQIPMHYLYDQIEDNWRGSGDKRIEDMLSTNRYLTTISRENWDNALRRWFEEKEMMKRQSKRQSILPLQILFLNYIYVHVLTVHDTQSPSKTFHIEHLVPVSKLSDFIKSNALDADPLPISAVSNLCYLDANLNRQKQSKTIYQFLEENPDLVNVHDIEEKNTFTNKDDLAFVDLLTGKDDSSWSDDYFGFLRKRFDVLINKFLELNHIK